MIYPSLQEASTVTEGDEERNFRAIIDHFSTMHPDIQWPKAFEAAMLVATMKSENIGQGNGQK